MPNTTLSAAARRPFDTLVVGGGAGARQIDGTAVSALRLAARRARRVTSVCTGAFALARAGLLDGRRATTHWAFCADLAREHTNVSVEPDPIYVCDGNVWTSAGVTAGIDLALALVEQDLGTEVATAVARWMVVFVRRAGGQSQFSAQLSLQATERQPIRTLTEFVVDNPQADLSVPALARRLGMSVRNFTRIFREETRNTPAAFVESARVEAARRLLETTQRSVAEVAQLAGFRTADAFRRVFLRRVRLAPREYRARFGR
jgi:transcriptional regulator GlxA family with amidase domain